MGRDAGAASFRDWKRAVDMKLSKRDEDLLYLVNHGERSALEERVLRELVSHLKQCVLHLKFTLAPPLFSLTFEPETKGAECPSDTVRM